MSNHILFLLADGFEETECVAPYDILIRGGVKVSLASIHTDPFVEGAHGLTIRADALLSELDPSLYSGIFLPGGGRGVENLRNSQAVQEPVRSFMGAGKWVTAICAAPIVFAAAGVLHDKRVTSYPSTESDIRSYCKSYSQDRVVVDGKLVTSRGPGSAEEFGLQLLALLEGKDKSADVRQGMVAR